VVVVEGVGLWGGAREVAKVAIVRGLGAVVALKYD